MTPPILLVTGDFVRTGGMDRANYALADHLSRIGREVHLATFRAEAELADRPNVHVHRSMKPANSYTLGAPILDRLGRRLAARITGRGGRVVVNGGNCRWSDVNWVHHINLLDRPKPGGRPWRRFKAGLDHRLHVAAERAALNRARILVTTCEKNRADLHERFGRPLDEIRVVYYGADPTVFHPASDAERRSIREELGWPIDRPTYAFAGGLGSDRRKGFDTLFAAWTRLCREPSWDANLVVIGSGVEIDDWRTAAERLGLDGRINFLGFRRDVPRLFRACDAHILPSRYEGYSLVTQEALCCGLPAFVTRASGISERYPKGLADALLINDPEDVEALVDRIRGWRDREEALRGQLLAFSDALRAHTWDQMARSFTEILDESAN